MSITGERIMPGLYYETWAGNITADEVYQSAQTRSRWAREDAVDYYIIIMDGETCKRLPPISSLSSAGKAHPQGKMHFIVVNLPRVHTFLVSVAGRFLPNPIETHPDRESAIAAAKTALREKQ